MKKFAWTGLLTLSITLLTLVANSQQETMPTLQDSAITKTHKNVAKKTVTGQVPLTGNVYPKTIIPTGKVKRGKNNRQEEENESLEKFRRKQFKLKIKDKSIYPGNDDSRNSGGRAVTPILARNFNGQVQTDGCPADNSIAISNTGYIVSASNQILSFYNPSGTLLGNWSYSDFFSLIPTVLDGPCDPRVIYDPVADRFIFFLQNGGTNATSSVFMCFSTTNDPMDAWNIYTFTDHRSTSYWFDFPNIGISTADFFVTGNLFDNAGAFKDNVVYQLRKSDGYAGLTMNYVYYTGLSEGINNAFTIVPCSYGLSGSYGPGIYMVSTEGNPTIFGSCDNIYVWTVTNSVGNSPQINRTDVSTSTFTRAADAAQLGSSLSLGSGVAGSRMQSAFYLGGYIQYVFSKDVGGTYSGIDYGRINVSNASLTNTIIYGTNTDYCYPSIASFGTSSTDKSVVIAFLKSDANTYPEIRYKYFDDAMNTVNSTLVKAGQSYIDYNFGGTSIRWGDYTGIQRRYNTTTTPACWLVGSYGGTNHLWAGYIAEIKDANCLNPTSDFFASPTTGYAPLSVNFTNTSVSNNSYSRTWTFTGATPASSGILSPSSIVYNSPGTYSVSLTNENACGSNMFVRNNYITVNQCNAVTSQFNYTTTDFTVTFINTSQNGTTYSWNFGDGNGSVSASTSHTYTSAGTYTVQLTVSNGCSSQTSTQSITLVCPTVVPSFSYSVSGYTVTLTNTSQNGTAYSWNFGDGNGSSATSPTYTYSGAGTYTVQLTTSNFCSSQMTSQTIVVAPTGINETLINTLKVYPNPTKNTLIIEGEFSENIVFELYNAEGQLITKQPAVRGIKQQLNLSSIPPGTYTVKTIDGIARFVKE